MEPITADTILDWFKEAIEGKIPVPPAQWLDAASKLNVLLEDIDEAWILARLEVARKTALLIESGYTVSRAKVLAEATDEYANMMRLVAKRERVMEFIRLAKKRAALKEWE